MLILQSLLIILHTFALAFIKEQTISEAYGNPWKTWIQMGRPRFPDKNTVETWFR